MNGRRKKILFFLFADVVLIALAMIISFLLRFEGFIPEQYQGDIIWYGLISIALTLPLLFWKKLYSFTWSFVSLNEIVELFKVVVLSGILFALIYFPFQGEPLFLGFPRSIIILHYALVFLFLGGLRSAKRIILLVFEHPDLDQRKNTLIIGANDRSDELIRTLQKSTNEYAIVGILDNNQDHQGTLLRGIKVLGTIKDLPRLAKEYSVHTLIIALPDINRSTIQKTISLAHKAQLSDIKIIPSIYEVLSGKLGTEHLRSVQVEDLLGRKVAHIETTKIEQFIKDKPVLITGAAGSIGSELCRQIAPFGPKVLNLLDYEESNLFNLARILETDYPTLKIKAFVADVRNPKKISHLFDTIRPHIIFHAAAYKHVPLMEEFPEEAVMTNVFGTLHVAKAAVQSEVEKFVLISTDKAVRPLSVMGKTKRLAEMIAETLNQTSETNFVSVRFGNVLGSRGSVLPIFQEQLKRRSALTVTDSRMARYFMTAPEACLLVLEAGAIGQGGEVFALDMGKPVKIVDLARELIRLSGLKPDKDIPIVFTRSRPGEKLFEDIFNTEEGLVTTRYQKIFRSKTKYKPIKATFFKQIDHLKEYSSNPSRLVKELEKLIK